MVLDKLTQYICKNEIKLPEPTYEQYKILEHILIGDNVCINSCPGSGKTTTIQYMSLLRILELLQTKRIVNNSEQSILVLMYNKALAMESRKKFEKNGCKNIKCQTIHSFAYSNYTTNNRSYDDTLLIDILEQDPQPNTHLNYKMIIIDEFQDATPILFYFVQKIIRDVKRFTDRCPQIIILGDPFQELYKFRGADARFMLKCENVFQDGGRGRFQRDSKYINFKNCKMSYTNRCPKNICDFINHCCKDTIMYSKKEGGKIRVCIGFSQKIILNELRLLKQTVSFNMDEVLIIVPSLKGITSLKNALAKHSIFVAVSDCENIDEKTTRNKILITTFHGSKGLERKIVFVTNFCNDYYTHFAKDHNPNFITNTFYVGLSRSSEYLYLIRPSQSEFPKWCKRSDLEIMRDNGLIQLYNDPEGKPIVSVSEKGLQLKYVTELTKNLSTQFKQRFGSKIKFCPNRKRNVNITYTDVICTTASTTPTFFYENGFKVYENISRFVGMAVTIFFELFLYEIQQRNGNILNQKPYVLDSIDVQVCEMDDSEYKYYYKRYINPSEATTFTDVIRYCVLKESLTNLDISILKQYKSLNYITDIFDIPQIKDRDCGEFYENSLLMRTLQSVVNARSSALFEQHVGYCFENVNVQGIMDIFVDDYRIVEIKFKNSLDVEDFVQLFIYYVLMKYNYPDKKFMCEIYNAKTGEYYTMSPVDDEEARELLDMLLNATQNEHSELNDEEFIELYSKHYKRNQKY